MKYKKGVIDVEGVTYIKKKIGVGCGELTLMVGINPKTKKVYDVYFINKGDACASNLNGLAIGISLALKAGVTVSQFREAFKGINKCSSFSSARAKGKPVSPGTSCGTAIIFALEEVEKEIL